MLDEKKIKPLVGNLKKLIKYGIIYKNANYTIQLF